MPALPHHHDCAGRTTHLRLAPRGGENATHPGSPPGGRHSPRPVRRRRPVMRSPATTTASLCPWPHDAGALPGVVGAFVRCMVGAAQWKHAWHPCSICTLIGRGWRGPPVPGEGGGGRGPAAAVHCRAAARPRARTQIAFPPPAHSLRIATDARQAPLRPRRAPTCTPWTRHQTRPATAPGCEGRGWWARARGRWAGWRWFGNPVLTHALHPTPATPLGRAAGGPGAGRRGVGGRVV